MISDERFVKAFEEVQKIIKKAQEDGLDHPSYFETLFRWNAVVFKEANVDYVVLETGLGGRLDATNTVDHPLVHASLLLSVWIMWNIWETPSEKLPVKRQESSNHRFL